MKRRELRHVVAVVLLLPLIVGGEAQARRRRREVPEDNSQPPGPSVVLRAERDADGFLAQQALVYKNDRVLFSRNSNFFCEPSTEVMLGVFERKLPKKIPRGQTGEFQDAEQLVANIDAASAPVTPVAPAGVSGGQPVPAPVARKKPRGVKFFAGGKDLSEKSDVEALVQKRLERACDDGITWKAQRAVLVRLENPEGRPMLFIKDIPALKKEKPAYIALKDADCVKHGDGIVDCRITGYGRALLKSK